MSAREWWIHLTASGGAHSSNRFHGTEAGAHAKGATSVGKVASWNCSKIPHVPNEWDRYTAYRLEEIVRASAPPENTPQ